MAGRYAKFKASFPFTPDPDYEGEIEIGDGDVIFVDAYEWGNDFDAWLDVASTDWMTGTNLRTGLKGMFPGNYVQFVQLMDSPLPSNVANTMPSLQHVHQTISEDLEGHGLNWCIKWPPSPNAIPIHDENSFSRNTRTVMACRELFFRITPFLSYTSDNNECVHHGRYGRQQRQDALK
ncbi:uncharacterized protein TRIADDRAFT_58887 [Trichoplax adhaerens]|uniref:SH3 domain-containing protein n=1 Tax=Trichoplax adhaerens TaxID=10228 RepID=B3S3Y3_TRIAD|nr:hypothetical protein TRIADDRAFT_58887 [Trichoplax adhaerens]EDV22550.1 hypothetical protein TRIADDRAFT_58887 [Trichoplax adhaerens]|eukprot:XP_002115094.1 hypothetical protein TRIADDRAFT_58887 [Trichoplax adhaerens]